MSDFVLLNTTKGRIAVAIDSINAIVESPRTNKEGISTRTLLFIKGDPDAYAIIEDFSTVYSRCCEMN